MPASSKKTQSSLSRSRPQRGQDAYRAEVQTRLGFSIKRAEQAMMVAKSKALREYDLSVAQYAAMLSLYYAPGQSAAQLARAAAVTPQTMATVLARLEAKKLITRVPSEIHSRVNVVTLTPARAVEDLMSSEFTPQEQEQLRDLLGRLVEVLEG